MKTPVPRPVPRPVARPKPKPSTPPAPKRPQARATYAKVAVIAASATFVTAKLVDVALIGSGIAAAAGSAAFAGFMLMKGDHVPHINGMEYLSVFAAPNRALKPLPETNDVGADRLGIDTTATGSISFPASTAASDYALVSARTDRAWVRAGSRILAVHPGDVLPNLGKVAEIVWSGDRWVVVGDDGEPLLASGGRIESASPAGPFAKPLILEGREN